MSKALYSDASRLGKPELLDTAMAYYKSILDTPVADFYKALALIGLAQCSDRKQDYNGSFNYYNQIILKYGKQGFNPMSIVGMARAKEMLGDATGAIAYYRQVIRDNPDSMWTRYAKGKIYSFKETVSGSTNRQQGTNANQTTSLPYIIQ
jgi:tetratricopeptide (TPR) repeat protein